MLNFAICNETFPDWPFEKVLKYVKSLEYEAIEIAPFTLAKSPFDLAAAKRAELKKQIEDAGLECVGLHWLLAQTEGLYLTSPDAAVRKKTADYLAELARLTRDLGGRFMVLGSPKQRNLAPLGISHEAGMKNAADCIAQFVPVLADCDVTLAIEPLGPEEGDFLNTSNQALELIDMIDEQNVQLHLDVKAMSTESKPMPDIIRDCADYLVHFHANDPNRLGPGMGKVDFVPILAALEEIEYLGWVSVEVFDYSPGPEKLATDSITYLKHCREALEGM